jgi:transmembrane sensor
VAGLLKMVRAGPASVSPRAWRMSPGVLRIAVTLVLGLAGWAVWQRRAPLAPAREYATAPGQRLTVSFSDGSRVLLGVASRLRVPRDYGVRARAVELEGEAYFVVRHDPAHPFLVRTAHGTTEDLGTEFDVRAYRDERSLQVVVAAGQVALRRAGGTDAMLLLRPRDRGVIDASGTVTRVSGVSLATYLAWIRGTLRFDDAPLGGVLAQLERWYDLEIRTTDRSLERERLTMSFTAASPDEALTALARVLGARFTRDDRVVRLIPVHLSR